MCPELCAGVFIRDFKGSRYSTDSQEETESPPELEESGQSSRPQSSRPSTGKTIPDNDAEALKKTGEEQPQNELGYYQVRSTEVTERLVGQIIATKTLAPAVTDASMEIPDLDEYMRLKDAENDNRGHHEDGSTVAIHSVVVDPEFQGRSIGSLMLKDYIQRMTSVHVADRFALLAHERLIPFYKQHEFVNQGPSDSTFSGGGWYSLVRPLNDSDDMDE